MTGLNLGAGSRTLLSHAMKENEIPIVYSTTHNEIIKDETQVDLCKENTFEYCYHYYIALSRAQGFQWNQDLFATQYQQNYQVEYDGNEDSINDDTNLLESQNEVYLNQKRQYRRKSNTNSISFKRDLKNGLINLPLPLIKYLEENRYGCEEVEEKEKELENKKQPKKTLEHYRWLLR